MSIGVSPTPFSMWNASAGLHQREFGNLRETSLHHYVQWCGSIDIADEQFVLCKVGYQLDRTLCLCSNRDIQRLKISECNARQKSGHTVFRYVEQGSLRSRGNL